MRFRSSVLLSLVCLASLCFVLNAQEPERPTLSQSAVDALKAELKQLEQRAETEKAGDPPSKQLVYYLIRGVHAESPSLPAGTTKAMKVKPNRRGKPRLWSQPATGVRTAIYQWPFQDKSGSIVYRRAELYTLEGEAWTCVAEGFVAVSAR